MSEKAVKTTEDASECSEEQDSYDDFIDFENQGALESSKQEPVTFVKLTDVMEFIQERFKEVNELLSVQDDEAMIILNHYKWRKDLIGNDWFENEERLRIKMGLEPKFQVTLDGSSEIRCLVCWNWQPKQLYDSLKCNHLICKYCWEEYILFNATCPENIFFWKCPMDGCNMIVPDSFNQKYIIDEKKPHYQRKLARTYTNTSKSFRWCPAPQCYYGVEVVDTCAQAINCLCGQVFCFKCGEEDHRPCTCEIAKEWIQNGEGKDTLLYKKWLMANTKNCPKCKQAIEKNLGCNHMTCARCQYEFCWQCLDNWDQHVGIDTAYNCVTYASLDQKLKKEIDDKKGERQKNLKRSCDYYEHFKRSVKELAKIEKIIKTLNLENKPIEELGVSKDIITFLQNACQTLKKTKMLVKWSYAYAFFINDEVGDEGQSVVCEILQEKLDIHSVQLQETLQGLCSVDVEYSHFIETRDAIQSGELDCRLVSGEFLDKIEEMEDKLASKRLHSRTDQGILSRIE